MDLTERLAKEDVIDLLNRCWMTHDGMWFFHCVQEFGIARANKINKAAIKSLAPLEISRTKDTLDMKKGTIETFEEFKYFFSQTAELFIPEFMNVTMSFQADSTLHWTFEPNQCFAYKGMKRMGVAEQYECGVIYRLECWFRCLGMNYTVAPPVDRCLMLNDGTCSGDFKFTFQ